MIPHFGKTDISMYYYYLNKAKRYFEFGSGGSTYQSIIRNNIERVYSVESDIRWFNKLNSKIKSDKLRYILVDLKCRPNNWGNPGEDCSLESKLKYSNSLCDLSQEEREKIDLILIDGRFRVACCLKSFSATKDDCLIIFDDFLDRKHYHVVLDYYEIIGFTRDRRMVVLKKKNCEPPSMDIIKKYEMIYD
jgi:hypothetical protein